MKIFGTCSVFLLTVTLGYAQYPGDISTNLRGWYKGNAGVTLTGGAVSQWNDQSGNNFHATQGTPGSRPTQNTTGFNYNPTITFDGQDNMLNVSDLVPSGSTGLSAFGVARQTGTGQDTWGCVILGQANGPAWTGGGYGLTALSSGNTSFGFWVRDYSANVVSKATTLSVPTLMSGIWNGTTANSVQYFQDGASQGTDGYTPGSVGDNGNTYIGSGFGTGTQYCFYGDIAEIVVYSSGLSAAQVQKINSYLALKYGITLSANYVNTAGSTIFATASPYNNNIIGIGRDDNNALTQKQSHNYDDSVRVYISTLAASNSANSGTFGSDLSYIVAGANTGRLVGIRTEKPGSIFSRLGREWMVTNTNFSSTFNMDFKLSSSAVLGSISTADLRLLVDDDGDFSDATVYAAGGGLSFSYSNPVITVTGIGTSHIPAGTTMYITVASAAGTTPLPIELLNFDAILCKGEVCLNWHTASEKNNDYYEIQRSSNGIDWETIRIIKAGGNSTTKLSYSEVDPKPLQGISYYRLKQNDKNAEIFYSPVVSVNMSEVQPKLYPRPADGFIIVENPISYDITLSNALGRDFTSHTSRSIDQDGSLKIITGELPEGIYFLRFNGISHTSQAFKLLIRH